jgi:hypothetical protein
MYPLRTFIFTSCWWLTLVILATQMAEIRGIAFWSQPGQMLLETLSRKYLNTKKGWQSGSSGRMPTWQEWGTELKPSTIPLPPKKRIFIFKNGISYKLWRYRPHLLGRPSNITQPPLLLIDFVITKGQPQWRATCTMCPSSNIQILFLLPSCFSVPEAVLVLPLELILCPVPFHYPLTRVGICFTRVRFWLQPILHFTSVLILLKFDDSSDYCHHLISPATHILLCPSEFESTYEVWEDCSFFH